MPIYKVANKVSCAYFREKENAEKFLYQYGTATTGFEISEIYLMDEKIEDEDNQP